MTNKKSSIEKKGTLWSLATGGGLRPKSRTQLGMALKNYLNPQNPGYDVVFATKIRSERPDWFENKADVKKAHLLLAAKAGKTKDDLEDGLWKAFRNYTNPKGEAFDPVFFSLISSYAPEWLKKKVRTVVQPR